MLRLNQVDCTHIPFLRNVLVCKWNVGDEEWRGGKGSGEGCGENFVFIDKTGK